MKIIITLLLLSATFICYAQVEALVIPALLDPPKNLQFSVNGSNVHLSWSSPSSGAEEWLYYHDGTFENAIASIDGGTGLAQRFTLSSIPATLNEIRFFTSDFQLWGKTLSVYILDNSGYTVLGGPYTVNGVENGWVNIATSVFINESHFMIATYNDEANGPYVAMDDSYFNNSLFFGNHIGGFTELSQLGDYEYVGSHEAYLIRAIVQYSDGSKAELGMVEGLLGYKLYRNNIKINNSLILNTHATDELPGWGEYTYNVTAVYNEA